LNRVLLVLLTAALGLPALGCGHRQPDPVSFLGRTRDAVLATDSVRYRFRSSGLAGAASAVDSMSGTVLIQRIDLSGSNYVVRVEAEIIPAAGPRRRVVGTRQEDGTIWRYEPENGRAEYGSIYGVGTILTGWMRPALMYPFFDPESLAGDIEAETVRWEGTDEVAGEACERVRVEFADDPERAEWCLGVDDGLPRRLELIEGAEGSRLEIWDINTDAETGGDRLELEIPEGVERVPVDYGPRPGAELPPTSFETPAGDTVWLTDLRGEVLVLDFWATWCVPCGRSMIAIEGLKQELVEEPVRFFAVNTMETAEFAKVRGFMEKRRLSSELLVEGDTAHREIARGNLPAAIVVDAQGRFVGMTIGYYGTGSEAYLEQLIATALAGE